jgi:CheY-like chemotaxis protein
MLAPAITGDHDFRSCTHAMATVNAYHNLSALVIDDQAAQQATLRGHLNLLGIGKVDGASSPDTALKQMGKNSYQLVLCDYNLENRTDGQQLLEHVRETGLLPLDCLFFMITAEASYASVAAASEHNPDAYMLKPASAADIAERLKTHLERRAAVLPILEATKVNQLERALVECDRAMGAGGRFGLQALQLKAQTLMKLSRPEAASAVYDEVIALRPNLVWAKLGKAKAELAVGKFDEALAQAQEIVDSKDGSKTLAAYDVIAAALEAKQDNAGAVEALKRAADQVPSPKRNRALGEAAYRAGDAQLAQASLQKVVAATKFAITAQPGDALVLAQAYVDLGQPKQALSLLTDKAHTALHDPQNAASAVAAAIQAQSYAANGQAAEAAAAAERARRSTVAGAGNDFATVALARAEIATGNEAAGLERLEKAMAADHENPRFKQLAQKALERSGHADKADAVLGAAAQAMKQSIDAARKLMRSGEAASAMKDIEATLAKTPNNTAVLLEAAQIGCMALRLGKKIEPAVVQRVKSHLGKLDKLLPENDRVLRMHRYLRDTVEMLSGKAAAPAAAPAAKPTVAA